MRSSQEQRKRGSASQNADPKVKLMRSAQTQATYPVAMSGNKRKPRRLPSLARVAFLDREEPR